MGQFVKMTVFKYLIILLFSGNFLVSLHGQASVDYFFTDQLFCANDTVRLPLRVRNFINVRNFQSSVRWDAAALQFQTLEEIHPALSGNFLINTNDTENGGMGYFWLDNSSGDPLVLADSSVLFVLKFTINDGVASTEVGFGEIPTLTETVVENNGTPVQVGSAQFSGTMTENEVTATAEIQAATALNNGAINLTTTNGQAPFSFLWNTGATTEDIVDLPPGNYQVTITDALDCTASFVYVVELNTATRNELNSHLITGPNPTRDYFNIEFTNFSPNEFYQYRIYNKKGIIIFQKNNTNPSSPEKIDLQDQPSGLYFLKLKTKKHTRIIKIIKN